MKKGVLLWHILTKLRIEANPNAHINVVEIAWFKNYVHFAIFHLNLPHFFFGFNRNCCYTSYREVCGLETSCRSRPKSNIVKDIYFL